MRKGGSLFTLVVCLLLAAVSWAQELPTLEAPKTEAAPKIDGDLSDPCWQLVLPSARLGPGSAAEGQAARASNFYLYDKLQPASVQTEALICYDDQALYVAFKCREPAMDKLVALPRPLDKRPSDDDCVELFLSTGTDGRTYYHFIVSALNAKLDQWNRVSPHLMRNAWDGDWESAVDKAKDHWTVEMAIPWYNFAADVGNRRWRINFCRGKRSLRMFQPEPWTEIPLGLGGNVNALQRGIYCEKGEPYTLSVYMKADRPGTQVLIYGIPGPAKMLSVDTEWKRYSHTVTSKETTTRGRARLSMKSAGTLWVDAAQLEEGDQASPYTTTN